ncbi:alpha-2,3-sialyltransferase [Hydrogenimonas sp.]|nr:alpha-2,3-sialyltransferase [Hydrogenimonas sp.]
MKKPIVRAVVPENIRNKYHRMVEYKKYQKLRNTPDNTYKRFDETQSIFIHIPKAAGISTIKSLYGERANGIGHRPYTHFIFVYGEKAYNRYFKFSFVRNPWDRLYSAYKFLKKGGISEPDVIFNETTLINYDTFESFVMEWVNAENVQTYFHFIPQYQFIYSPEFELMVDFVGRFENLNEDYEKIREKIGTGEHLKHLNKTKDKKENDYREVYTPEMAEKVAEVYKKDIELFGYSF